MIKYDQTTVYIGTMMLSLGGAIASIGLGVLLAMIAVKP